MARAGTLSQFPPSFELRGALPLGLGDTLASLGAPQQPFWTVACSE